MGIRTIGGRGSVKLAAALVALLCGGIFVSAAFADGSSPASAPTVATDKAAYVPGDTVHVTGAGWLPNESVHVHAAADGHSFAFDSDVVASVDGNVAASFVLPSDYADTFAVALSNAMQGSVSTGISDAFAAASSAPPPTIISDKNDYAPGSTVTLTGANWPPGDAVHVVVNDTVGQTWQYAHDVATGSNGEFTLQLQLPNYFVSDYDVTATGSGGATARTSFTDANVTSATIDVRKSNCSTSSNSFTVGDTVCAHSAIVATSNGQAGDLVIQWILGGVVQSSSTHNAGPGASFNDSLTVSTAGTWTVRACTNSSCPSNQILATEDFTVAGKQNQTITFAQPTTPQAYGNTFHINPTASSGLAVSVSSTGPCTVGAAAPGYDVTMTAGSGNCVLTASQSGNANFNAAPNVSQTVAAQTRAVTVTADAKSKIYGGPDPALTYQITSGSLVGTDIFAGSLTRAAGESVGGSPYAIQQGTLALSSNYSLTFVGANFSIAAKPITVTADAKSKTYGAADPAFTYQLTSGTLVTGDSITGSLTRDAGENVGQYDIKQGILTAGANYDLTFVGAKLTINQRPITVTADVKSKTYGDADPALTYQLTSGSLQFSDTFAGALTRDPGQAAGQYDIKQGTLTAGANYDLTFVGAKLTINQRPITVTAVAKSKTYGDADPALSYQVTNGSLAFSDAFSGALTRDAGESVGQYDIKQGTLTAGANYNLTFVGAKLTIGKATLAIDADGKTKVFGNANPTATYSFNGFKFSDNAGNVTINGAADCSYAAGSGPDVGTYPGAISCGPGNLSAANYDFAGGGKGDLTITARPVEITADGKSKTYGDSDPALTFHISSGSLASSDAFSGSLARAAGEDVGDYAITQGSVALSSNYTLTFVGAKLTVNRRAVEITADAKSKTYGLDDPALTYKISDGSLAFSDAFTGNLDRAPGEAVGDYDITQGTLALSDNYTLTYKGAKLTIDKRAVEITADAKSKTYGDADPALTYTITNGSLAFSDAFTGSLSRDAGENVGDYPIQQGTVALNGNYALTYKGAKLTIGKRLVEITAGAKSKTYGDADPALTYTITNGSLAFSDAFTGSLSRDAGEDVGTYDITQGTLALSGNYMLSYNSAKLTISKATLAVNSDGKTKAYGDPNPAPTYSFSGFQFNDNAGNVTINGAAECSYADGSGPDAGKYEGAISCGPGNLSAANYDFAGGGKGDLTITPRSVEIAADGKSKTYGDSDPALTFHISSGSLASSDAFSGSLARAAGEDVGDYAITQGSVALSSNYTLTFVGAELTIEKRPVEVTADPQSKTYGNDDPALTYQMTSGSLAFNDQFTGSLTRAAGENVGNYAIQQGSVTLNANYDLSFVGGKLTIKPRAVEITVDAKDKTYGNDDPALTYQITTGSLAFSDQFTGSLTRAAGENVGDYAIQQGTVALNANYDLSFVGANLTIKKRAVEITAENKSKIYGDADPALTYKISTGSLAFTDGFTGSLTRDAGEPVGSYAITQGTVALSDNYTLTFVAGNLTVNKATLAINADGQSKVYGEANPTPTFSFTGFKFNDNAGNVTINGAPTCTYAGAGQDVGLYPGVISCGPGNLSADNYDFAGGGKGALTITKRPIEITADPKSKTYGDNDPALTFQVTKGNLVYSDTFGGTLARNAGEAVGDYAITQGTVALSSNYDLSYKGANLTITKRAVEITADAKSKTYGNSDPELTYQITNGSLAFSDKVTGALDRELGQGVGQYAITQGTLALNANYDLTYKGANLTIGSRPVTVTADAKSKTYGDADPALTYKITNGSLAYSDAFAGDLTRDPGKAVGDYSITQGTLALNPNYTLTYVGAKLTIGKRPVTGNFTAANKIYDGDNSATVLSRTLNNTVVNDDVSLTGGTATFANKNVANGKVVTLSSASLAGNDAGNYTLGSVATTTADITAKPITGSFIAANKMYDSTTAATVTGRSPNGVIGGDAVSLTGGTATFADKNVGAGKTVTLTGASLSGADSSNYSLTSVDTAKADITKAPLTVTADNQVMTLNGTVPPLTYKATGFVNNETAAVVSGTASCTTADGKTIGTFDIVCAVGTLDAQNYAFTTFVKGKLTVYYRWDGFLQPINDTAHTGLLESSFKLGQTIPAKFNIKDAAGNVVQQAVNPTFTKTFLGASCGQTIGDTIDATVAPDPSTVYTWDGSQYHYNWSTKGLSRGEYRIYANLADGTKQAVNICLS